MDEVKQEEQSKGPCTCNRAPCDCCEAPAATLPDWQIRFRQEYEQLKIRHFKLHKMLVKLEAGTLEFEPKCPAELLKHQEEVMAEYLRILETRAEFEKVSLPLF